MAEVAQSMTDYRIADNLAQKPLSILGRHTYWFMLLPMLIIMISMSSCNANETADQLSGGYTYRWENDRNIYIYHKTYSSSGKLIPCTVIEHSFDENFIIAAQEPGEDCLQRREDAMKSGKNINYWIADNNNERLFGPLSFDDYLKKRAELEIPEKLKLDIRD